MPKCTNENAAAAVFFTIVSAATGTAAGFLFNEVAKAAAGFSNVPMPVAVSLGSLCAIFSAGAALGAKRFACSSNSPEQQQPPAVTTPLVSAV